MTGPITSPLILLINISPDQSCFSYIHLDFCSISLFNYFISSINYFLIFFFVFFVLNFYAVYEDSLLFQVTKHWNNARVLYNCHSTGQGCFIAPQAYQKYMMISSSFRKIETKNLNWGSGILIFFALGTASLARSLIWLDPTKSFIIVITKQQCT